MPGRPRCLRPSPRKPYGGYASSGRLMGIRSRWRDQQRSGLLCSSVQACAAARRSSRGVDFWDMSDVSQRRWPRCRRSGVRCSARQPIHRRNGPALRIHESGVDHAHSAGRAWTGSASGRGADRAGAADLTPFRAAHTPPSQRRSGSRSPSCAGANVVDESVVRDRPYVSSRVDGHAEALRSRSLTPRCRSRGPLSIRRPLDHVRITAPAFRRPLSSLKTGLSRTPSAWPRGRFALASTRRRCSCLVATTRASRDSTISQNLGADQVATAG